MYLRPLFRIDISFFHICCCLSDGRVVSFHLSIASSKTTKKKTGLQTIYTFLTFSFYSPLVMLYKA